MTDRFPNIDEFGAGSCTCKGTMTGCAVCATANIAVRYGKRIPRLTNGTPDMRTFGAQMGLRHRQAARENRHGLNLSGICTPPNTGTNWCAYCAYLQLKGLGIPAGYGVLSRSQLTAHLKAKHPIVVPGRYGVVPFIRETSYSSSVPARGRSDSGFTGAHMVTAWEPASLWTNGSLRQVVISDADFGSASRPVVPPHSVWSASVFWAYVESYRWAVAYCLQAAPRIVSGDTAGPAPTTTVTYRYGGQPKGRGSFRVKATANLRRSPYVRSDNVIRQVAAGTTFACRQTTWAGTNVGGNARWVGTDDGQQWIHSSLVEHIGDLTGREAIR